MPAEDSGRETLGHDLAGTVMMDSEDVTGSPAHTAEPLSQARLGDTPQQAEPESSGLGPPSPGGQAGPWPGSPAQVETVVSMDPGALHYLQLHHADLLAGLGDVGLVPLEGSEVTGFRVSDAWEPISSGPLSHSRLWDPVWGRVRDTTPVPRSSVVPQLHAGRPRSSCRACWAP